MTVTPIRRHKPKPADREFQASMARNLARIVAGYDTAGTSPEVAADVRAIPDLLHDIADTLTKAARELEVHAEEARLDRLAEAQRDAYDEREAL